MAQRKKSKKKRRGQYVLPLLFILLLLLAAVLIYKFTIPAASVQGEPQENSASQMASAGSAVSSLPVSEAEPVSQAAAKPVSSEPVKEQKLAVPEGVYSHNLILVRLRDEAVLMEKESGGRVYPASLTKIMTALVVLEHTPDLGERVLLSDSLFEPLREENASMAGFVEGEKVKAIDLLYGVLLPSGAECCAGLADWIAGSEEAFAALMNEKAQSLGMKGTHFTNTTGLQAEEHYTTVKDLSVLLAYALKNDTFREIFTTSRHSTASTNKHPDGITFYNTMFRGLESPELEEGKILGGKTGFTDQAGLCLASLAEKEWEEYILITVGAQGNHQTEPYHLEDALEVYNSFENNYFS